MPSVRITLASLALTGYFARKVGQFSCISCDDLGDFYQELPGALSCNPCPQSTQRYVAVLSGTNRSACQCKNGAFCQPGECHGHASRLFGRVAGYFDPTGMAGQVGSARSLHSLPGAPKMRVSFGFAGVHEMYEPKSVSLSLRFGVRWAARTL
jgi:hypothetical protein